MSKAAHTFKRRSQSVNTGSANRRVRSAAFDLETLGWPLLRRPDSYAPRPAIHWAPKTSRDRVGNHAQRLAAGLDTPDRFPDVGCHLFAAFDRKLCEPGTPEVNFAADYPRGSRIDHVESGAGAGHFRATMPALRQLARPRIDIRHPPIVCLL